MKLALVCLAVTGVLVSISARPGASVQTRQPATAVTAPRIAPLPEAQWSDEQRTLVHIHGRGPVGNDVRTFLRHPELVKGVLPFANYILNDSTLTPRHRALLILRTAWLCRSIYYWARHADSARGAGLTPDDISRVARGPEAEGWTPFEAAVLRAADELYARSFVSTPTWMALSATYSREQMMDAVFTVTELTMLAMTVNSLTVPTDAPATAPLPRGTRPPLDARRHAPLTAPRVPPLAPEEWTPEIRKMLDPTGAGRDVAAVYRTFAQHQKLYPPRQILSEYIRLRATISSRIREIAILRIGYLCYSEYEWSAHARAGRQAGLSDMEIRSLADRAPATWIPAEAAVVRAVDELFADDVVSDATWKALSAHFSAPQLMDLLITTGGYRMVSMALNTFGVPLEPNGERFPR